MVRRIFQMCVSGLGPTQIAKQLKAVGIPTPSEHGSAKSRNYGVKTKRACDWGYAIVAIILDRQEYVGGAINFRTYKKSFRRKKRYKHSKEEWKVFSNTHPAIVDRETFALVQNLRQHRRRPTKISKPDKIDDKRYQQTKFNHRKGSCFNGFTAFNPHNLSHVDKRILSEFMRLWEPKNSLLPTVCARK